MTDAEFKTAVLQRLDGIDRRLTGIEGDVRSLLKDDTYIIKAVLASRTSTRRPYVGRFFQSKRSISRVTDTAVNTIIKLQDDIKLQADIKL